jgi:GPN-loop GTPase
MLTIHVRNRFLLENLDFLTTALEPITEEYLLIIDMPGQIELYTHVPVLPTLVQHLTQTGALNINLCAAYLLESTFVVDRAKFFAGTLSAMSAMIMLEVPHVNILSKMDLVKDTVKRRELKRFIHPDSSLLDDGDDPSVPSTSGPAGASFPSQADEEEELIDPGDKDSLMRGSSFKALNRAVARLIDDFSMVSFLQLNAQEDDSVRSILSYIDDAIQFHEAQEPTEPKDEEYEDGGDDGL